MVTRITRKKAVPVYRTNWDRRDLDRLRRGLAPRLPHQGAREKARRVYQIALIAARNLGAQNVASTVNVRIP